MELYAPKVQPVLPQGNFINGVANPEIVHLIIYLNLILTIKQNNFLVFSTRSTKTRHFLKKVLVNLRSAKALRVFQTKQQKAKRRIGPFIRPQIT